MAEAITPDASPELFLGQPCIRLRLDTDHSVLVALQGAQVLSWVACGTEQFYLSPRALLDGHSAIRGGVPVCFPQFNERGPLPKHGFARNLPWMAESAEVMALDGCPAIRQRLVLHDDAHTRTVWPHAFAIALTITLSAGQLTLALDVDNSGTAPLSFMAALHTYFRVDDIGAVALHGLDGCARWDALTDTHAMQQGPVRFAAEYDQVYTTVDRPLRLEDGGRSLHITHSTSFGQTVVWNPGATKCATLADMPVDGYRSMLCAEAAQIEPAVLLAPGARWSGSQHLALA